MNKLQALLAQLKALDAKIDALLEHDQLTEEQRAEHDKLVADRKALADRIELQRAAAAREEERVRLETEAATANEARVERERRQPATGAGRLTDPDGRTTPAPGAGTAEAATPARPQILIPATVRRYGSLKHFRGTVDGYGADQRAFRFGMWGMAMLSAMMPHRYRFQSANDWIAKNMAASLSMDANGTGYLIPEEFSNDMIDLRETFGVARRLLHVEPMTSDTKTFPRRVGGLTAYFPGEGGAGTESNAKWDRVRLTAKDPMVLSRFSGQVDADASINFGDRLAGEIAYAFASLEDDCAFNGDGSATYAGIQGIRNRLDNVDGAGTDAAGLVTQATGTTWAAQVLGDFDKVVGKLPQFADTPNCAWVCHRTYYYEVIEKLVQAAGGVTAREVREGQRGRPLFKGYPVEFSQKFPNTTASGQVSVILGDLSVAATLGDRQQNSIAFSDQASINGESLFERNEIGIRGIERFDVNVHDVGDATTPGPVVGLKNG